MNYLFSPKLIRGSMNKIINFMEKSKSLHDIQNLQKETYLQIEQPKVDKNKRKNDDTNHKKHNQDKKNKINKTQIKSIAKGAWGGLGEEK